MVIKLTQKCWDKLEKVIKEKAANAQKAAAITGKHFSIYLNLDSQVPSSDELHGLVVQLQQLGHGFTIYVDYTIDDVYQAWLQNNTLTLKNNVIHIVNLFDAKNSQTWSLLKSAYLAYVNDTTNKTIVDTLISNDVDSLLDDVENGDLFESNDQAATYLTRELVNYLYIAHAAAVAEKNAVLKVNEVLFYFGALSNIVRHVVFTSVLTQILISMGQSECPYIVHLKPEFELIEEDLHVDNDNNARPVPQLVDERPYSPSDQLADEMMVRFVSALITHGGTAADVIKFGASYDQRKRTASPPSGSPPKNAGSSFNLFDHRPTSSTSARSSEDQFSGHAASNGYSSIPSSSSSSSPTIVMPVKKASASAPSSIQTSPVKDSGFKKQQTNKLVPTNLFAVAADNDSSEEKVDGRLTAKKMRSSTDHDDTKNNQSCDDGVLGSLTVATLHTLPNN